MYLWDANILRAFGQGHATLRLYLLRVPWAEIALPSVVVAEVLRGRCEFALKATPAEAPLAHQRLLDTQQMLAQFHIVVFDVACATVMERLRQQHRRRKRYADLTIAAMVLAGQHTLVTRNRMDFVDVLPATQLANWIDDPPDASCMMYRSAPSMSSMTILRTTGLRASQCQQRQKGRVGHGF